MQFLVDMNLSPRWVPFLKRAGHGATHWSEIGPGDAPDDVLLRWADEWGHVVFTNDLDFASLLAAMGRASPSVVQLRMQDLLPERAGAILLRTIERFEEELRAGALVSVDVARSRARLLPL